MNEMTTQQRSPLILVVDDDRAVRSLLRTALERRGYAVEEAQNGTQAIVAFERLQPDVVFLDVLMPNMDGFDACSHLRALPGGERTPILMITALDDTESVDRAFEVGATDYITKPIHLAVLRQRVRRLLHARQAEEALIELNATLEERVRQRTRDLEAALEEKVVLLKEVHHRVKNNLQLISSLLDLQSDYVQNEQARQLFQESRGRIRSMALIHDRLYRAQDLSKVNLAEHIQSLTGDLFRLYRTHAEGVTLTLNAEKIYLGVDVAVPCGLVVNELVSNALKHAFPGGVGGEICVELLSEDGECVLYVRDDGVGFPPDLDFRNAESLGLKLIATLVKQLKGDWELEAGAGTTFVVRFPALEQEEREKATR